MEDLGVVRPVWISRITGTAAFARSASAAPGGSDPGWRGGVRRDPCVRCRSWATPDARVGSRVTHTGPMRTPTRVVRATARVLLPAAVALQSLLLYMPASGEGSLPVGVDKVAHAGMFGGVAILALVAGLPWLPVLLAAYAPISELLQGLPVVDRDPDWRDIVADITGIVAAVGLFAVWRGRGVR